MAAFRLAMTPDTSAWTPGDLRWAAGFGTGLWKDFVDESEAQATGNWLAGQGWTVAIEPMESERQ